MSPEPSVLNTLEERVVAIVTKQKRLQPGQVTIDSTFADLSIDSLDGMELVFEFEEAFPCGDKVAVDLSQPAVVVLSLAGPRIHPPRQGIPVIPSAGRVG